MLHTFAAIPFPSIDPVLFRIGPVAIRWYGLAYLAGFAVSYLGLKCLISADRLRITREQLFELITWLVVGVIAGGRTGWWLFYHRGGTLEPWYEPLAIWHGGMSFHGGLIGVAAVILIWSWRNGVQLLNVADALALVTPVGLFMGRIANFINAELVGRPTSLPWGVIFPGDTFGRHPAQLYEAILEGPLLLIALWVIVRHNRSREGVVGAMFLVLYGLLRFAVEFTRQPDEQLGFIALGWLTMGQLLSCASSLAGVLVLLGVSGGGLRRTVNGCAFGAERLLLVPPSERQAPRSRAGTSTVK